MEVVLKPNIPQLLPLVFFDLFYDKSLVCRAGGVVCLSLYYNYYWRSKYLKNSKTHLTIV